MRTNLWINIMGGVFKRWLLYYQVYSGQSNFRGSQIQTQQNSIPLGYVPPASQLYVFWWLPLDVSTDGGCGGGGGGGGVGRSSSEQV